MRGGPGMAQPGFAATRFSAELGASPPLPLHPPRTSTPNSPMGPLVQSIKRPSSAGSKPFAVALLLRQEPGETLCSLRALWKHRRGPQPWHGQASHPHLPTQPLHGVTHSHLTLP